MFSKHAIDSKLHGQKLEQYFFMHCIYKKNVHIYKIEETAVVVN